MTTIVMSDFTKMSSTKKLKAEAQHKVKMADVMAKLRQFIQSDHRVGLAAGSTDHEGGDNASPLAKAWANASGEERKEFMREKGLSIHQLFCYWVVMMMIKLCQRWKNSFRFLVWLDFWAGQYRNLVK